MTTKSTCCVTPHSFWAPRHLVTSAWLEHAPFAFWLAQALRPRVLVEQGTYFGFSYLAFCQAVQQLGLSTRCYAIDTWEGDNHARFNGNEVFEGLNAINEQHYASFSRLMRLRFDQALPYFPDGQIDLLHIDGRHKYEDVLQDFTTWLPKLSGRAVVLFHDTNVREREFGVWKLWNDLSAKHPSFEFIHGHGLGVLGIGSSLPEEIRPLFECDPDTTAAVRAAYARLGATISSQAVIDHIRSELLARDRLVGQLRSEADKRQQALLSAIAEAREQTQIAVRLQHEKIKDGQYIIELEKSHQHARRISDGARQSIEQLCSEAEQREQALQAEAQQHEHRLMELEGNLRCTAQSLHLLQTSTYWRASAPIRAWTRRFPGLARQVLRFMQLCYWTLTGQLLQRLMKRRAQAAIAQPPQPLETETPSRYTSFVDALLHERYSSETAERVKAHYAFLEGITAGRDRTGAIAAGLTRLQVLSAKLVDNRPIDVSIIVSAYNNVEFTISSVHSLLQTPTRYRYEVIVGDNCSTDETAEVFGAVGGIVRCITHAVNEGFTRNCNLSALHASGRYLVLLNNDTIILDGWLDALIEPLQTQEDVGLVGSRLLFADGLLQEAGCIYWCDGTAWNFGRGEDPRLSQFNYVKEVDYCSGAAIAIRLALWQSLGGFDERYKPAYCEDSDLAFAVRDAGYRVLYTPFATLIHHEGITHGTDTGAGVKAYQIANQYKLLEKWRRVLEEEHFPNGEHVPLARDRSRHKPHILVADHYVPQPDRDAGSRTMFDYLCLFAEAGFQVTFWPENLNEDRTYAPLLQRLGIEVICGTTWEGGFESWCAQNGPHLTYAFLSRPSVSAPLLPALRKHSSAKVLFYGHDIVTLRVRNELAIVDNATAREELAMFARLEPWLWRASDIVLYPSHFECDYVRAQCPDCDVQYLQPYAYSEEELAARAAILREGRAVPGTRLLFVGGFSHRPNVDAMLWFCREVLPLIQARIPGATLCIAGSHPPPEISALARPGIAVTGFVTDTELAALYDNSAVAVIPLRFGGGVKGKLLEALSRGVPVVSTDVGVQGLKGLGNAVTRANSANPFAGAVVDLLKDPALQRRKALAGLDYLSHHFTRTTAVRRLADHMPEFQAFLSAQSVRRDERRRGQASDRIGTQPLHSPCCKASWPSATPEAAHCVR
jgi:O-antigen biosynthesis protein